MPPTAVFRHRSGRLVAGVVLVCCAIALQAGGLAGVASADQQAPLPFAADPEVAAARAAQERAEAELAALSAALDEAADAYERAHAHAMRLQEEFEQANRETAARRQQTEQAVHALEDRVVRTYKRPAAEVQLAEAVMAAESPGIALHRVALLRQLNVRGAQRLAQLHEVAVRTREAAQQQHFVLAGSSAAAAEAERSGQALATLVEQARLRVERAREQVATAEDDARADARRAAEEAAAAVRAAQILATGAEGISGTWTPGPVSLTGPGAGSLAAAWLGAGGPVYCPVAGPTGFTDSWGYPRSGGRQHQGVDMFAAYGTPTVAVTDGFARRVYNNRLGGLSVDVVTANGDRFYYTHLSAVAVTSGQPVAAGQVIGAVGNSGNARGTPPHLHWQFHPGDGGPVNPYPLAAALCR